MFDDSESGLSSIDRGLLAANALASARNAQLTNRLIAETQELRAVQTAALNEIQNTKDASETVDRCWRWVAATKQESFSTAALRGYYARPVLAILAAVDTRDIPDPVSKDRYHEAIRDLQAWCALISEDEFKEIDWLVRLSDSQVLEIMAAANAHRALADEPPEFLMRGRYLPALGIYLLVAFIVFVVMSIGRFNDYISKDLAIVIDIILLAVPFFYLLWKVASDRSPEMKESTKTALAKISIAPGKVRKYCKLILTDSTSLEQQANATVALHNKLETKYRSARSIWGMYDVLPSNAEGLAKLHAVANKSSRPLYVGMILSGFAIFGILGVHISFYRPEIRIAKERFEAEARAAEAVKAYEAHQAKVQEALNAPLKPLKYIPSSTDKLTIGRDLKRFDFKSGQHTFGIHVGSRSGTEITFSGGGVYFHSNQKGTYLRFNGRQAGGGPLIGVDAIKTRVRALRLDLESDRQREMSNEQMIRLREGVQMFFSYLDYLQEESRLADFWGSLSKTQ